MTTLDKEIQKIAPLTRVIGDCPMKDWTSFQAGGKAAWLIQPTCKEDLIHCLQVLQREEIPFFLMGKGSNILVRDGGYSGAIVQIGEGFSHLRVRENQVEAGAGCSLAALARFAAKEGLSGLEFASGIPGSVGGGVYMNAGAYDGEMKEVLTEALVLTRDGKSTRVVQSGEMKWGYRRSLLMDTGEILLEATFALNPENPEVIFDRIRDLTNRRNRKQPMDLPSAGSFFKRPVGAYAGKLIEEAGLKGMSVGGAQVSTLHCGFLVNRGDATANDILSLMHMVQAAVLEKSGILLEPEVRIVGEEE